MKSDNIFPIGSTEGNQIEIDDIGNDEYRLICRDHFSQNFVDYYVHRNNLKGLADFIYKIIDQNKKWVYAKPIIGMDDKGNPIAIDSWNNKENN